MIPVQITQLSTNKNPIHLTLDVGWVEKYKTVTGNPIVISDGVKDTLLKKLQMTLDPKQSGSGTPSPDNIRPISGWDEVETVVSGKNLIDQSAYTWLDATSYSNGVFTAETLSTFSSAMVRLYKNGTVVNTINKAPTEGSRVSINVTVDDTWDVCFIGYRMGGASNVGGSFNKPIVADGTYTVSFMADKLPSTSVYGKFSNIQFEQGSTATDYEPYDGHTYTTDLPQTVYGGTLDVVSGVLTVDRAMVDLGTLNWTSLSWGHRSINLRDLAKRPSSNAQAANLIAEKYATQSYESSASDGVSLSVDGYLAVTTTVTPTGQLAYELATPTTIQCGPQTVSLLAGENVIMGDGDMEITYRVKASA